ncbi:uncharacterized protein LOC121837828 [Ixodes scapularis]|uniref:uncharacterized protein LOC121837828 n=1 Tax=Ixodes scapularis TaxID=6945 RepID=UPI001C385FD0|nr:uncharacterized protein LOC121837828 [Ixodes scapularis]
MAQSALTNIAAAIPPPPVFLAVPGTPVQVWPAWKEAFLSYLHATGIHDVPPAQKKHVLFSMLGVEGQRIVSAFQLNTVPATEHLNEFEAFLAALEKHFEFSGCVALERKKLRSRTQLPGETVSEFLAALRHQGSFCAYGTALDEHLCDVFLEGLDSRRVQDRILRECVGTAVPTLNRAVQLALQFEQLARTSEQFHQRQTSVSGTSSSSGEVQYVHRATPFRTGARTKMVKGDWHPRWATSPLFVGVANHRQIPSYMINDKHPFLPGATPMNVNTALHLRGDPAQPRFSYIHLHEDLFTTCMKPFLSLEASLAKSFLRTVLHHWSSMSVKMDVPYSASMLCASCKLLCRELITAALMLTQLTEDRTPSRM